MSNQITVLRVQPIKDAKNQTSGYEVFDVVTNEKFDSDAAGLRHIMMHLAFQNGQYVYRYGKKWRRANADAKIFATYAVAALKPIVKPASKGTKRNILPPAIVDAPVAETVAPTVEAPAEVEVEA